VTNGRFQDGNGTVSFIEFLLGLAKLAGSTSEEWNWGSGGKCLANKYEVGLIINMYIYICIDIDIL
jgi:hypothetical protein